MRRAISCTALSILMLLLSLGQAAAQQNDERMADRIHAQALQLQQDQTKLVPAARLYLREAALRGDADPQRVKSLTVAAHLLYYGKRRAEARRVMEQAAEAAMGQGDVAIAANTYLLAAWMAQGDGKDADKRRLAQKAQVLAGSPLLATVQRDAIMARVNRITTISLQ